MQGYFMVVPLLRLPWMAPPSPLLGALRPIPLGVVVILDGFSFLLLLYQIWTVLDVWRTGRRAGGQHANCVTSNI